MISKRVSLNNESAIFWQICRHSNEGNLSLVNITRLDKAKCLEAHFGRHKKLLLVLSHESSLRMHF